MTDPLVAHSRETIRRGSRSFFAAANLFDPATRESAFLLYAWCRYCDDQVDLQDLGRGAPADARRSGERRLERLFDETRRALAGERVEHPAFAGLERVVREHSIPHRHPLELLEGFRMDVEGRDFAALDDTLAYCYHVAGVVGLMMAHAMGVRDEPTLDRACDLGIAFQLTNIARDVLEDAEAGRVYLPGDWLREAGVPPGELARPAQREALARVVGRLLAEADRYYRSSAAGIAALAPRQAWAIATARRVYGDIGRLVRRRGASAWDRRAVVSTGRKLWLVLAAAGDALWAVTVRRRAAPRPRGPLWTRPGPV